METWAWETAVSRFVPNVMMTNKRFGIMPDTIYAAQYGTTLMDVLLAKTLMVSYEPFGHLFEQ